MRHDFTDPDLMELDRIWPLGQLLTVPDNGTILVAGAYEGRYIAYLHQMFPKALIVGYEPQGAAFDVACNRTPDAKLYNYGLATASREMWLGRYGTDGASVLTTDGCAFAENMVDAVKAIQNIPPIDLFVMNMEGYEWALIPYLLDEMMHHRIRSLAIQFHAEYVSSERANRVLDYLGEYYLNTFKCPGWTYWERKN